MNSELLNTILERQQISKEIKNIVLSFDEKYKNITFKKGIYIYGSPGCGKTEFIMNILKEMDYDIIKYDAGYVRNKSLIESITNNNISNQNVLQMMRKKPKKIVIVMDEIDGMNNGDKGGITSLIKLIRQKKTKKQKLENMTMNPIICIGNYYIDKKIRELMKVCHIFELKTPTIPQVSQLITTIIPSLASGTKSKIKVAVLKYIQGDIRKLAFIQDMFSKKPDLITEEILDTIFHTKLYNEDSKKITQHLIQEPKKIEDHNRFMNETERTIVALLWHENIVDAISIQPIKQSFPFYQIILDNMTYADYIDRITFQNQIWQFNEMSSLMKTFYNNKLYHDTFTKPAGSALVPVQGSGTTTTTTTQGHYKPTDIRFTKVLTKYSTEYNNMIFIYNLCQELDMDKRDLLCMFQEIRLKFRIQPNEIEKMFENYNVNRLDIRRMYRFLDKNMKPETEENEELEEEENEFL
jgi:DNA polymerase III delta prime subunit